MTDSRSLPTFVHPNFITEVIDNDLRRKNHTKIVTRFPPEPNGYAHLGHAIASYLNFGIANDYAGEFRLRMDDTNPEAEKIEFADAIIRDMEWLGYKWGETSYASNYFAELHEMAVKLIRKGVAYVDSVTAEEMAKLRGNVEQAGIPSPFRERTVNENLELFAKMKAGEYKNGQHVLRAKIDLSSSNMKMRDPVIYRIVHAEHYRTGNQWCIYPSYDFAQATTDALDGVTHSLCSLEFIDNRAVYDWLMDHLWDKARPHQYEFGRRSLEYTVVSKRKLKKLVEGGFVEGWDDPRMPTISGQRRRGVRPEAIRKFASQVGITRTNRTVDIALFENAIRDDLNLISPRVMAVVRPLKVVISNAEDGHLTLPYYPQDVLSEAKNGRVPLPNSEEIDGAMALRLVPFGKEIYIEHEDFEIDPPAGFKRLRLGGTVRLRGAGIIRCDSFDTNPDGNVSVVSATLLGDDAKAKGVIHWVDAARSQPAEFKLYDRLFSTAFPEADAKELEDDDLNEEGVSQDFLSFVNSDSLEICHGYVEESISDDPKDARYQFERLGYFWQDQQSSTPEKMIFQRIISLKDSWHKEIHTGRERPKSQDFQGGGLEGIEELNPVQKKSFAAFVEKGISEAEALVIVNDGRLEAYLNLAAKTGPVKILASLMVNELGTAIRSEENKVTPAALAELAKLLESGEINNRIAKDVLLEASKSGEPPAGIVLRKGLKQVNDTSAIEAAVAKIMEQNLEKVNQYRAGKEALAGFFVGQTMREMGGQANPQVLQEIVKKLLSGN